MKRKKTKRKIIKIDNHIIINKHEKKKIEV